MTIVLNDQSRVVGVWFVHTGAVDWMACVWRDDPRHAWTVRGRFRRRRDELLPWSGSDDDKLWSTSKIPAHVTEDDVVEAMGAVAERIAEVIGATPERRWSVVIKGSAEDFEREARKHAWFNGQTIAVP